MQASNIYLARYLGLAAQCNRYDTTIVAMIGCMRPYQHLSKPHKRFVDFELSQFAAEDQPVVGDQFESLSSPPRPLRTSWTHYTSNQHGDGIRIYT